MIYSMYVKTSKKVAIKNKTKNIYDLKTTSCKYVVYIIDFSIKSY